MLELSQGGPEESLENSAASEREPASSKETQQGHDDLLEEA